MAGLLACPVFDAFPSPEHSENSGERFSKTPFADLQLRVQPPICTGFPFIAALRKQHTNP